MRGKAICGAGIGLLCLCLSAVCAHSAQTAQPTGYEGLTTAGKLATECRVLQTAVRPDATLTQKQLAIGDDKLEQALSTLRAWLDRPDRNVQAGTLSDLPPETMSQTRMLARALAVEQYVLLAAGRVGAAIESARDGLRLSYALKPDSLIVWLVSAAVDTVVTQTVAKHLDQLSQKDCLSLMQLAKDWIAAPDPTGAMLDAERERVLKNLSADDERAQAALPGQPDNALPPGWRNRSKAEIEGFRQQVSVRTARMFIAYREELNRPLWEHLADAVSTPEPDKNAPLPEQMALALFNSVRPALDQMVEARGKQQVRARLLGCHAAIRSYRWEHDALPASLDELKLGDMAIDPFTGEALLYKLTPERPGYTLQSAGPPTRDAQGKIKPGERAPFGLTP